MLYHHCYTLNEYYNRPLFKLHFIYNRPLFKLHFLSKRDGIKMHKSEIVGMVMDFSLSIFRNTCYVLA